MIGGITPADDTHPRPKLGERTQRQGQYYCRSSPTITRAVGIWMVCGTASVRFDTDFGHQRRFCSRRFVSHRRASTRPSRAALVRETSVWSRRPASLLHFAPSRPLINALPAAARPVGKEAGRPARRAGRGWRSAGREAPWREQRRTRSRFHGAKRGRLEEGGHSEIAATPTPGVTQTGGGPGSIARARLA